MKSIKKTKKEVKKATKPVEKKRVQKKACAVLAGLPKDVQKSIEVQADTIISKANGNIEKDKLLERMVGSYQRDRARSCVKELKDQYIEWYDENRENIVTMSVCLGSQNGHLAYSEEDNSRWLYYNMKPLFDISVVWQDTPDENNKSLAWLFAISCMSINDKYSYKKIKFLHGSRLVDAVNDDETIGDMHGYFEGTKPRHAYDALRKICGEIFVDALSENKIGLPKRVVTWIKNYNLDWCTCFLTEIQRDGRRGECPMTFDPFFEHIAEGN